MDTQVGIAKSRLYGEGGLGVSDFKMFPGESRDVTPEQMAGVLNKALAQLEAGDYELVDGSDND